MRSLMITAGLVCLLFLTLAPTVKTQKADSQKVDIERVVPEVPIAPLQFKKRSFIENKDDSLLKPLKNIPLHSDLYTRALHATTSVFYDSQGTVLLDESAGSSRIGWENVDPDVDTWTSGVFRIEDCAGSLLRTWEAMEGDFSDNPEPPTDYPAYGVTSAFCFLDKLGSDRIDFDVAVDLEASFKLYSSTSASGNIVEKVSVLPLVTFNYYGVVIVKFDRTAKQLYDEGLHFYPLGRYELPQYAPDLVSTVSFRVTSYTQLKITKDIVFEGPSICVWEIESDSNLGYSTYRNQFCLASSSNFQARGSPTFDGFTHALLYLMDNTKQTSVAGTRVDWLGDCFVNGVFSFARWQCLSDWKIYLLDNRGITLDGAVEAKANFVVPGSTSATSTTTTTKIAATATTTAKTQTSFAFPSVVVGSKVLATVLSAWIVFF